MAPLQRSGAPEIQAEMFIVVTYRPKWLLWHKSEKFPMKNGENRQRNVDMETRPAMRSKAIV